MMARFIPWSEFESEYASLFSEEMGAPAKSFRMALGALIIKEKLGIREARNSRTKYPFRGRESDATGER
jgi:hypothetical protein